MNLKTLFTIVFMALFLSSCGNESVEKITPEEQIKIDAAIEEIKSESRVQFFSYENVWRRWNVAVISDDHSEYGYANYICEVINGHGLNSADQDVQIFDIKTLSQLDTEAQKSLIIRINCGTREVWSK